MKKILISIFISSITFFNVASQDMAGIIPKDVTAVIKYNKENFTQKLMLHKIDGYKFVKENLFKNLNLQNVESMLDIGIDFEKDIYQYLIINDSFYSFTTLLEISNKENFLNLIKANSEVKSMTLKNEGIDFLSINDYTYVGFNNKYAVIVATQYLKNQNYWDAMDATTSSVSAGPITESYDEAVPPPPPPPMLYEKKSESIIAAPDDQAGKGDPPAIYEKEITYEQKSDYGYNEKKETLKEKKKKSTKKPISKKGSKTYKKIPLQQKKYTSPKIYYPPKPYVESEYDKKERLKRDSFYEAQRLGKIKKQRDIAYSIVSKSFELSIPNSILTDEAFVKCIDNNAGISVFTDIENAYSIYQKYYLSLFRGGYYGNNYYGSKNIASSLLEIKTPDIAKGTKIAMNAFFEKDQLRIEQKYFSMDEAKNKNITSAYNSKQSNALISLVNSDNIGFVSYSINTEGAINSYYETLKSYVNNLGVNNELSLWADVSIDLLSIVIDEKGIADLIPGNSMFVMHGVKNKKVSYVDYEYNPKTFKSTPINKTKDEMVPDFTFAIETKKQEFAEKLLKLPLKYKEKEHINYNAISDYYELVINKKDGPISNLYFKVKNGVLIVSTLKSVVEKNNDATFITIADSTKKSIMENNIFMNLNTKKMLEAINPSFSSKSNKEMITYMENNLGDFTIKSGIQNNISVTNMALKIKGNHENSLAFIFNMIQAMDDINTKEKSSVTGY